MENPWYDVDFEKDVKVFLELRGGNHLFVVDPNDRSDKETTQLAASGASVTRKTWDDDSVFYSVKPSKKGDHAVLTPFIWVAAREKDRPGDSVCSITLRQGAELTPYAPPGSGAAVEFKCDKAGKVLLPVITIHLTNGRWT